MNRQRRGPHIASELFDAPSHDSYGVGKKNARLSGHVKRDL
jgi:hypothetical protein